MKFKVGQIYFWNGSGTFFTFVTGLYNYKMFNDKDLPTHIGIITKVEKDRIQIHEALNDGLVKTWYETWWVEARIEDGKVEIGEVKEKMTNVEANADNYLGIKYGWMDIFTIGIGALTGFKFGLTGKTKIICSEAVNYIIYDSTKQTNIAAEYGISPDSISPAHIYLSGLINIL